MTDKRIIIIAGPNGAGKTTFAREFLPNEAHCRNFVNADLIAAGLAPFDPERAARHAARVMLDMIDRHAQEGESFVFETTLSGKAYLPRIKRWQALGYRVSVIFLMLPEADMAVARVAERVKQGGHNIPEVVIRRRFVKGWQNFKNHFAAVVDEWVVYDNSNHFHPVLIERSIAGETGRRK